MLRRILARVNEMGVRNPYGFEFFEPWQPEPRRTVYETLKPKFLELVALGKSGSSRLDQEAMLTAIHDEPHLQGALLGILFRVYQDVKASSAETASCLRKALRPLNLPMRMLENMAWSHGCWIDTQPRQLMYTEYAIKKVQPHMLRRCLAKLPLEALRVVVAVANAAALWHHIYIKESVDEIPWFWVGA